MEKLLFATKNLESQETEMSDGCLEYYLLTEPVPELAADCYGIEAVLHRGGREERGQCRRIAPIGSHVLELLTRLSEGRVTPGNLQEIVVDLLP